MAVSRPALSGLLIVLAAFAAPMFVGLRTTDLQNDEAIYSYTVERMLETGDWLTARSIPSDGPFLEKPPLKFWMTGATIASGLLPMDELGFRFVDVLLGAFGLLYVFAFGRMLAGTWCGVVSVLVLFTLGPLLFEHGLRGNNMEAAVFLAYCGGLYHFARWREGRDAGARHAWAVAGYFVLGFMTKFVAALFLPIVMVASLAGDSVAAGTAPWRRWREWLLPSAAILIFCLPWFVYEAWLFGDAFWQVMFGAHVYDRFTASLDPTHLNVWHFYASRTWREIVHAGSATLVVFGVLRMAMLAWRGEWLPRLILLWAAIPLVMISFGASKLLHYAYPFWPPIGLAAGLGFAFALDFLRRRVGDQPEPSRGNLRGVLVARVAIVALAGVFLTIAVKTAVDGPVVIEAGGSTILRNSSVVRPLIFALAAVTTAAISRGFLALAGGAILAFVLPLPQYADTIARTVEVGHPIRTARDCIIRANAGAESPGVTAAAGDALNHPYFFYLRRTGPWTAAPAGPPPDPLTMVTGREQRPLLVTDEQHAALVMSGTGDAEFQRALRDDSVRLEQNIVMVFPRRFAACANEVRSARSRPTPGES